MMRAGPGRNYPGIWLYIRRDLPVRVVAIHESWRKIEDPGGTQGWMLVHLLSADRTGLVTGEAPQPIHEAADPRAPVRFRAEPGVVGRVSRCRSGWCRFEVGGRQGHIRAGHLWGLDRGEAVE